MAARARAIQSRLERLAPAVEELFVAGIVTAEEKRDIARTRQTHEYKLVARPLLMTDVCRAIDFELALDAKVASYSTRNKMQLKHRWAMLDRVESLYIISIPRLEGAEQRALEQDFIAFLRKYSRHSALSRYFAEALTKHPREWRYWCMAAEWEAEQGNVDLARTTAQRGVELLPDVPQTWIASLFVELEYAATSLDRIRTDSANEGRKAEALRLENDVLGQVLLDLELCATVAQCALASSALSNGLLPLLVATITARPFTRDLLLRVVAAFTTPSVVASAGWSDVVSAIAKAAAAFPRLQGVPTFIEGAKAQATGDITLEVLDHVVCALPAARKACAAALVSAFENGSATDVADTLARRFIKLDFHAEPDSATASPLRHAIAVDGHVGTDTAAEGAKLLSRAGMITSASHGGSTFEHIEKLIHQGSLEEALAALRQAQRSQSSADTIASLCVLEFALLSARVSRKRQAAAMASSDEDEDDTADAQSSEHSAQFRSIINAALRSVRGADDATSASLAVVSAAVRCSFSVSTQTPFAGAASPLGPEAVSNLKATQLSALANALVTLSELTLAWADKSVSEAILTALVPSLIAVCRTVEKRAPSLWGRCVSAVRSCFETSGRWHPESRGDYATFEMTVAKRPDLARRARPGF